jgi:hypothetical protein
VLAAVFVAAAAGMCALRPAAAEERRPPNFTRGMGRVAGGLLLEAPKTIMYDTKDGAPVVGTAVGLLAAPIRAAQEIVGGMAEMAAAFDPWGIKKEP